jgi:hypothetical protein
MSSVVCPKNETILAYWRVGLVAYREAARKELHDIECDRAGQRAMMAAFPELDEEEAGRQIVRAVAWCSWKHRKWLDHGVPRRKWIWPPDHRGVGLRRNPGYEDI